MFLILKFLETVFVNLIESMVPVIMSCSSFISRCSTDRLEPDITTPVSPKEATTMFGSVDLTFLIPVSESSFLLVNVRFD